MRSAFARVRLRPAGSRIFIQRKFESTYEEKYAEKVKAKLGQLGLKDISEFRSTAPKATPEVKNENQSIQGNVAPRQPSQSRRDSSPVTPLSDIMDLSRILKTSHTSEQIGTLWNAYHTSKSATGKGYLSAVMPRATYESFLPTAKKYPSFILPLPRPEAQVESSPENPNSSNPYEFYYMEWAHHHSPAVPSENPSDLFSSSKSSQNPPYTTVIFTPLQEYKLRQSFALPHLILTHYTDLAHTHDVVLMRGELTPSTNDPGRFLLSPSAAQILAFGLQQFYLPEQDQRRRDLLSIFHEKPQEFSWEELISAAQI